MLYCGSEGPSVRQDLPTPDSRLDEASPKNMAQERHENLLLLFGDQTFTLQPHLGKLLQHPKENPVLESFLTKAYDVVRSQISVLARTSSSVPRLQSIEDLLDWRQQVDDHGQRCIAIDMAAACLFQLANFILVQDQIKPWLSSDRGETRAIGFCTGALAAAAVSCSTTGDDLIPLAVEAVGLAFKIGALVGETSRSSEAIAEKSGQNWAMAVLGPGAAEAVNTVCSNQTEVSRSCTPYITAHTPRGVTVSGPPNALADLEASPALEEYEKKSLPLHGLYHAPHLYSRSDIDSLIASIPKDLHEQESTMEVISGSGDVRSGRFGELLDAASCHILLDALNWNNVVDLLTKWCQESSLLQMAGEGQASMPASLHVLAIGSKAGQLLMSCTALNCSVSEIPGNEPGLLHSA